MINYLIKYLKGENKILWIVTFNQIISLSRPTAMSSTTTTKIWTEKKLLFLLTKKKIPRTNQSPSDQTATQTKVEFWKHSFENLGVKVKILSKF